MKTVIIIPARYGSTRFPGKPLALISGQSMLERVSRIAKAAVQNDSSISCLIATDDKRIGTHAEDLGLPWVMTSETCKTGTERSLAALAQSKEKPDFVINLQGDAPLTPPDFIRAMISSFKQSPCEVITPVTQLTWQQLDKLRESKQSTPFSGTTVTFDDKTGAAFWFSKTIIPSVRNEQKLREENSLSPVWRHVGIYGYSYEMLQKYEKLAEGKYEKLEGLEQLRLIENGFKIRCVPVDYKGRANMSGVDSKEDILRAEALIAEHGELLS